MRGTIEQRGPKSYRLRVYAGRDLLTGKPRQVSRTFHGGKRAAQSALAEFVTEVENGRAVLTGATFGQVLDRWLARQAERGSPTTARSARLKIEGRLRPALGHIPLGELTGAHLDAFYGALRKANLSPRTIHGYHAIVRSALGQAVKWGWTRDNVAKHASPPSIGRPLLTVPTDDEVRALIVAAESMSFGAFVALAAVTGARRGELCGLRWGDVDAAAGALTIRRSIYERSGGGVGEKDTKTHAERRALLGPLGLAVVATHRARCEDDVPASVQPDRFMFADRPDGRSALRPDQATKLFGRARTAAGVRRTIRLHDLRHYAGSRMLGGGIDPVAAAAQLGHANPSTTMGIYGHALEGRARAAADLLDSTLALPE